MMSPVLEIEPVEIEEIEEIEIFDEVEFERSVEAIVRDFELADPRDRWRHTGEAPPPIVPTEHQPARSYRTPQSTVDAFWYVVRNESAEYLSRWLARHPMDTSFLHKLWIRKC